MKKILKFLLIFAIGFIAGNLFWYLASPLWVDRVVNENIVQNSATEILKTGEFQDADLFHKGSGKATISTLNGVTTLSFENFKVTNGPDLYVWLVKTSQPINSQAVKVSEVFNLGLLKGNIGNQNYSIPREVDLNEYGSVVIWCKQFGVLFAYAQFETTVQTQTILKPHK